MQPRQFDPQRDFPAVAQFLGQTRSNGGMTHPGGMQWWLRDIVPGKDRFEAFVVDGDGGLAGFVLIDDTTVVSESDDSGVAQAELLAWTEQHMHDTGRPSMTTNVDETDEPYNSLEARGFERTGTELELMTMANPSGSQLPGGFRFASLEEVGDDVFIAGHRAAWSDTRPSPYRHELHEVVKKMPQFRPDLVTIARAPDGTVASYCIGWMDEASKTLEIEPLGTHRDYRRLGLARAVVREVNRRAYVNGAHDVLVWNEPATNAAAHGLYTSAAMAPRRTLAALTKQF